MKNQDGENTAFIITGMHRSGTSLTSSLMESAGVNVGMRLMGALPSNPKGHFENLDFVEFHERALQLQDCSQEGWTLSQAISISPELRDEAKLIIEKNSVSDFWGWKDPRTTLFLDFWKDLLPQAYFIFTYRSPWEVVDSLYRRGDKIFTDNPIYALEIWIHYNKLILDFCRRFPDKSILLNIETLISDRNCIFELCKDKFGIDFKYPTENIVDKSLMSTLELSSHRPLLINKFAPEAIAVFNNLNNQADIKCQPAIFNDSQSEKSMRNLFFQDWANLAEANRSIKIREKQIQQTQPELDRSKFQLQQAQSELERSQFQLQQAQRYFEDAINEISSMETSKFWKLRQAWFEVKRLASLSRQTLATDGLSGLVSRTNQKIQKKFPADPKNNILLNLQISKLEPAKPIDLQTSSSPIVSIIVPVFNQSHYTFNCLNSLNSIQSIEYEVIVVDDASTDDTQKVLSDISGIRIITNDSNAGFIRSCNRGAAEAQGEFICFLNNDTKVFPNWLESLLELINNDLTVGAVGSKLIYPDGRLQEAGGIIWKDASGCNFGRLEDPTDPAYNYVREVDYCSGASLLVRRDLFNRIGGFSEEFLPAYYEDTDLCFTIRSLGYKVMYQPRSQVIHFEGISSGTDIKSGVKKYQQTNAIKFEIKWRETLKEYLPQDTKDRDGARRYSATPTILIIDSYVPLYDKEAGSLRLYNIIKIFKNLGYSIIFLPDNGLHQEPYVSELQEMGVEVIYSTDKRPDLKSYLLERLSIIDIAWVCRPELCEKYFGLLSQNPKIKIIYDTIDLHFIRLKREKELLGEDSRQPVSWQDFQKQELKLAKLAHETIVVTNIEKDILSSFGISNISVIPTIHEAYDGLLPGFEERKGLLFVGGYNHTPNVDAAIWLCENIMPLIWQQYPDLHLTLLGSNPPSQIRNLQNSRVSVTGYIRDIEPYFLNHRVFVVPLRYGAGMKGKVGQSLSYGLPMVTTSIGAEGFDLTHEQEAMIADKPEDFAANILKLYGDLALWQNTSKLALQSVEKYTSEVVENKLRNLIDNLLINK
jgi:O-antigen biosynthesis protein